jgi:hypothetical protein
VTLHSSSLAPDWKTPLIIVRGISQDLGIRLRDAGSVVTPTSGTVALYRDVGETDTYLAPTALTPGATSLYTLPAVAASEALASDWVAIWPIVSGALTYRFRQRALLVGTAIHPRVSDEDLYGEEPTLRHPARLPEGQTSWQPQISDAWVEILNSLTARGKQPWLSIDDLDLYRWLKKLSLAKACAAIPDEAGGHYSLAASRYRKEAGIAEVTCTINYETSPGVNRNAGPSVIPCAPRGRPVW